MAAYLLKIGSGYYSKSAESGVTGLRRIATRFNDISLALKVREALSEAGILCTVVPVLPPKNSQRCRYIDVWPDE